MKSQAKSFDKILIIRLSELSTASSSYLAAIIKEFRLQIKDDIDDAANTMDGIGDVMTKVEQILKNQRHKPELFNIYLLFIFIFVLLLGIYATLRLTRNSIVTFLRKESIQMPGLEI